jgi:hypothetical protein
MALMQHDWTMIEQRALIFYRMLTIKWQCFWPVRALALLPIQISQF